MPTCGPSSRTFDTFIRSLTNCAWIVYSMTHNERTIRPLWLWSKSNTAAFSILQANNVLVRLTPTVGPRGWSTGFLPTWMSEPSLPPVLSSFSATRVQHNPPASISCAAMCDVDWDVFPRLGPGSRSDVPSSRVSAYSLVRWYSYVACNPLLIMLLWEFKNSSPSPAHLCPSRLKRESGLSQVLSTSNCRRA